MTAKPKPADRKVRALTPADLERVVAIDKAHTGQARRRFYERRLEAASRHPEDFIYVGVTQGGALAGFAFARLLHGEFGRDQAIAALDIVGVDPAEQDGGIGHALIEALLEIMRRKKVRSFQSQAEWTNHSLLKFFDSTKFSLAPRMILERPVNDQLDEPADAIA
jgi:GNAT superfamily N-acetyltransferase